jgi:hypothetical protein
MAATGPISIEDETGIVQLAGTATFPDGIAADGVSTPDVAAGNSDPITIKTGDAAAGDGGGITIEGGDGDPGSGTGGSVIIESGSADTAGNVELTGPGSVLIDPDGQVAISPATALLLTPGTNLTIDPAGDLTIGDGYLQLTVAAAVPTVYTTPLHYDSTAVTGGLYAWDGTAYQKVGNVVS